MIIITIKNLREIKWADRTEEESIANYLLSDTWSHNAQRTSKEIGMSQKKTKEQNFKAIEANQIIKEKLWTCVLSIVSL